jgi:hypothetical protein
MIEEKILGLFEAMETYKAAKENQEKIETLVNIAKYDSRRAYLSVVNKKTELGKILEPLRQDIWYERDGIKYCIFCNRKTVPPQAVILPMLTTKEADISLSVHKLEVNNEGKR